MVFLRARLFIAAATFFRRSISCGEMVRTAALVPP